MSDLPTLSDWLDQYGLSAYLQSLRDNGAVDLEDLLTLDDDDVVQLVQNMGMKFIHSHRFKSKLKALREKRQASPGYTTEQAGTDRYRYSNPKRRSNTLGVRPAASPLSQGVVIIDQKERDAFSDLYGMEERVKGIIEQVNKHIQDVNDEASEAERLVREEMDSLQRAIQQRTSDLLSEISNLQESKLQSLQSHLRDSREVLKDIARTRLDGERLVTQPVQSIGGAVLRNRIGEITQMVGEVQNSTDRLAYDSSTIRAQRQNPGEQIQFNSERGLVQRLLAHGIVGGNSEAVYFADTQPPLQSNPPIEYVVQQPVIETRRPQRIIQERDFPPDLPSIPDPAEEARAQEQQRRLEEEQRRLEREKEDIERQRRELEEQRQRELDRQLQEQQRAIQDLRAQQQREFEAQQRKLEERRQQQQDEADQRIRELEERLANAQTQPSQATLAVEEPREEPRRKSIPKKTSEVTEDVEEIEPPDLEVVFASLDYIDVRADFDRQSKKDKTRTEIELQLGEVAKKKGKKKVAWESLGYKKIASSASRRGSVLIRVGLDGGDYSTEDDVDILIEADFGLSPAEFAVRAKLKRGEESSFSSALFFEIDEEEDNEEDDDDDQSVQFVRPSEDRPSRTQDVEEKAPPKLQLNPPQRRPRGETGVTTGGYFEDPFQADHSGVIVIKQNAVQFQDFITDKKRKVTGNVPTDVSSFPGLCEGRIYTVAGGRGGTFDSTFTTPYGASNAGGEQEIGINYVFRVGGRDFNDGLFLASVDALNLDSGSWSSLPEMNQKRSYCQAVVIQNKLLTIGGKDKNAYLDSIEEYDFEERLWTELSPMTVPRYDHAACVFSETGSEGPPDRVFVCGGFNQEGPLNHTEMFKFTDDEWVTLSPMKAPRYRCTSFYWAVENRIMVVGGLDAGGTNRNIVEMYDPVRDSWQKTGALRNDHDDFPAAGVFNGQPFVVGNRGQLGVLELYDRNTNSWEVVKEYPASRHEIRRMIATTLFQS